MQLKPQSAAQKLHAKPVRPGEFRHAKHYYNRLLNAQIHPLMAFFLNLSNDQIVERYCRLAPEVRGDELRKILAYKPRYLSWAGADLFHVVNHEGARQMLLIELNSCPSGQKSMPLLNDVDEAGGYRQLLENSFLPLLETAELKTGDLAVVYDKNPMENSGYAAALADLTGETVHLVSFYDGEDDPALRFSDGVMEVRGASGRWHRIRACLRYVTQRPWNRIPLGTKTLVYNPVIACLAGGRNKVVADKAYEVFNDLHAGTGLKISVPETLRNVTLDKIPWWIRRKGGHAVIKNPYSNAGQGVWTVTNRDELRHFLSLSHAYGRFLLQGLIGNAKWSSQAVQDTLFHVGTVPNAKREIFAFDLRFMAAHFGTEYRPVAIYARRARKPLTDKLLPGVSSWDILGTNLTVKKADGTWDTESERLMLMDRKDFSVLGLGLDELIQSFLQTVFAMVAIDQMAMKLVAKDGKFNFKLFRSFNDDPSLIGEIRP